ncbi:hypothetical protein AYO39_01220 [Actinobacteria bacterium SCGC AG-212-D09]|nr:hypothetical protein AYO39_01220 [Actinobacteria bacterium SCGC AG-212-D09]
MTRYWIGHLLTTEQTSTQAQLLLARALEDQAPRLANASPRSSWRMPPSSMTREASSDIPPNAQHCNAG